MAFMVAEEDRALIANSVLRSLTPPDADIDAKWGPIAKRRLEELRSGRTKPVAGDEVFDEIWQRFTP